MSSGDVLLLGGGGLIGNGLTYARTREGRQVYVLTSNVSFAAMNTHLLQGGGDNPELMAKLMPRSRKVIHWMLRQS
jgi:hypothetical protein